MTLPKIAITMGDPCGIGPEIIAKALNRQEIYRFCRPVVVGLRSQIMKASRIVGVPNLNLIDVMDSHFDSSLETGGTPIINVATDPIDLPWGKTSAAGGQIAYECVVRAVELACSRRVDAICTAPLSKEALALAGWKYPGHTELIAELTGAGEVSMMLTSPKLRVIHVTTHIGLLDAIDRIEPGLVFQTISRGHDALLNLLKKEPKIGVCAINPHAGENGLFGRGEEETKIAPAIRNARSRGWAVEGPLAADTLFFRAARGDFDLVVAMYHDQGHGPIKVLGLDSGVNVTVGLPIIRTSVDHGTAFDIAGTGIADDLSLIAALKEATNLVQSRQSMGETA
jgi:4-phospho-D-threonate 3-dehydrogenase / 4-phospho-D-erythronate 3-dehydrogenase